jgi:DNA primase
MSLFNYLKGRLSILDVIGEYTHLKKAGTYWKGHCPFHSEKTASFTVSPHKEIFYCFGCHIGGDVITFISKVENCSAMEAVHHLAERYGIELPHELNAEAKIEDKKHYYDLCKLVATWCHEQLKKSPPALHYLLKRGFTKEIMQQFSIGYFPGGYLRIKELISFAQKNNVLAKDLVEAGILQEGRTVLYSSFEERIIFPIKDHLGRHCGFGGRIFKPQDERPKYYNSRENPFFNKGSLLFGFDSAKKSMQQKECAFLVEGYADCIAMVQHGYTNTIATLGTACTPEHLKLLSRYVQKLYVLYDGDRAGKEAIIRLTSLCWQASLELQVVSLPAKEDPASLLSKGIDLMAYIQKAQDIFVFYVESQAEEFAQKSMAEKLTILRKLLQTIQTVEDPLTQDLLLQRAAKVLEMPFETLKKELIRSQQTQKPSQETQGMREKSFKTAALSGSGDQKLEKNLFFAILNDTELINNDNVKFLLGYLPTSMQTILKKLEKMKTETPSLDFIAFFDSLDSYEKEFVSKSLLECEGSFEASMFDSLVLQLQRKNWKMIVHSVKQQLDQAKKESDHIKEQQLLHHFLEMKKKLLA